MISSKLRALAAASAILVVAPAAFAQQGQTVLTVRQPAASGPALASGGGATVDRATLDQLLRNVTPEQRTALAAQPQAVRQILVREVLRRSLLNEAIAAGVNRRPEVQAAAEAAALDVILEAHLEALTEPPAAYPSVAEMQEVYRANPRAFLKPVEAQLSQFSVPVGADAAAAQRRANELRGRAAASQQAFQQVAAEVQGGSLGWLQVDSLQPEIKTVVDRLQPNQLSEPIRLGDAYVVMRLDARRGGATATFEESQQQLRAFMRAQRQQQQQERLLAQRGAQVTVEEASARAAVQGAGAR